MTNQDLVAAAISEMEHSSMTLKAWRATHYASEQIRAGTHWGKALALFAQVTDAAADPLVPTGLKIEHVGDVQEETTIRTWVGREVTISGRGPAGRRVQVIDLHYGLCGGDEIDGDGKWRVVTVVLPLGTTRQLVARSIKRDGTEESADSIPVEAEIPPA